MSYTLHDFGHRGIQTDSYKVSHKTAYKFTHELLREFQTWGTYGKKGDQPLKHILIKDIEDDRLINIISHLKDLGHTLETHTSLKTMYDEVAWRMRIGRKGKPFWQKI